MRKAFLIGFQYSQLNNQNKKLPGIIIDLYKVYCFLISKGWKEDEIIIFSDIIKDDSTNILRNAILEKIVDSDILTFIEDCKERKQYILFTSHNHYNNFSSIFKFEKSISSMESNDIKHYFVYYTGHCKDGNLILPNNTLLSLELFRDYISPSPIGTEKVICIMDCCEGGIELPFVLHNKVYRCKQNLKKEDFINTEMVCISSSLENEKSITSQSGSFFTRNLLEILDSSQSLSNILEKVRKSNQINREIKQTATISVSLPHISYLFGFLYSFPTFSIYLYNSHLLIKY